MKPKCLGLELKRRHGAIVVGLNNFSVILLRPVIIIHWSWPGLGNSVNRWLGDKKYESIWLYQGSNLPPTIKVRILRTRYQMRLAWRPKCKHGLVTRSSSEHNMPKEAKVQFGFGSADSESLVWR